MKVFNIVLPFFATMLLRGCFSLTLATNKENSSRACNSSLEMNCLISVDYKSYFVDRTTKTWAEASTACSDAGLKLATITSDEQWRGLMGAYNSTDFHHGHWTAGRDAQELRQFSWNDTKENVAVANFNMTFKAFEEYPYQTCLAIMVLPGETSYLTYFPCSQKLNVLCETPYSPPTASTPTTTTNATQDGS